MERDAAGRQIDISSVAEKLRCMLGYYDMLMMISSRSCSQLRKANAPFLCLSSVSVDIAVSILEFEVGG